jgi:ABC-type siderophore export system fused ATPase/permease subunit
MRARSALVYSVLRLLAFLVPLGILLLFPVFRELPWLAAVFAALIGLSLSLLFLRRPLDQVTGDLAARRAARRAANRLTGAERDADAEDAAVDAGRDDLPDAER